MAKTLTTKELAEEFETDPRTLRKFLRATLDETPGKGSRYAIQAKQVRSLKSKFQKWDEARRSTPAAEVEENEDEANADA